MAGEEDSGTHARLTILEREIVHLRSWKHEHANDHMALTLNEVKTEQHLADRLARIETKMSLIGAVLTLLSGSVLGLIGVILKFWFGGG